MRRIAWFLLLLFAFTIPWEYSLELANRWATSRGWLAAGAPGAIPRFFRVADSATPDRCNGWCWLLSLVLQHVFLDHRAAGDRGKIARYFQELMIVWLVWEFAEDAGDLRKLLRVTVAGSWVLAALTVPASPRRRRLPTHRFVLPPSGRTRMT